MISINEFDRRVNTVFNRYNKIKNGQDKLEKEILSIMSSKSDITNMMEDLIPKYLNMLTNNKRTYYGSKSIVNTAREAILEAESVCIPLEDMDTKYIEYMSKLKEGIEYGAYHMIAYNFALIFMTDLFKWRK